MEHRLVKDFPNIVPSNIYHRGALQNLYEMAFPTVYVSTTKQVQEKEEEQVEPRAVVKKDTVELAMDARKRNKKKKSKA